MYLHLFLIASFSASCIVAVPDKIVCYHESWSNWRPTTGKFNISNVDTELCTHVIFSYIGIQPNGSIFLKSDDTEFLLAYGVLKTRNPSPKLLVSISGWNDLSLIAANSNLRNTFLNNSVNFLKQYCFDGIDFNLEDPGDIERDSITNNNIVVLLEQFRVEFNKNAFLLTARVSSTAQNYNVPSVVKNLDLVNVKTYHFQGIPESAIRQNLPYLETVKIINAWKNAGTPPEKLILGITSYGSSYKLHYNSVGAPVFVPGNAGQYTQQSGSLSYLEICEKIKDGVCDYKWNKEELVAYANCDNQWVIYENSETALKEAKFALDNNLGGMFIWSVNTDDFRQSCGSRYPLLNAIKIGLKQGGCTGNCSLLGNIICYQERSSYLRQGLGQFGISAIDPNLCTHVIVGPFSINNGGAISSISFQEESFLSGFRAFKAKNPGIKLLFTFGGKTVPTTTFPAIARDQKIRKTLLSNIITFIGRYGFDGFDLHWQDLTDPIRGGNTYDMNNFVLMLTEYRTDCNWYGYLLTATLSASTKYYNVPGIAKSLDFLNIMTFGFHGPWESSTGVNSPNSEVVNSILAWKSAGAPTNKLVLGIATYGISFTLSNATDNGIGALATGHGTAGPYTKLSGFLGYNEICEKLMSGWTRKYSNEDLVPYAYSGNQWVGYDDAETAIRKAQLALSLNLGGVMVWSIDTDDFRRVCGTRYPILNAVKSRLVSFKNNLPHT